jgi:hypothetical protein
MRSCACRSAADVKRTGISTAPDRAPTADVPNRVWAVDFQFDATTDGRPIKIAFHRRRAHPANASAAWSSATSPAMT